MGSATERCPQCGTQAVAGLPGALCPVCLLALAERQPDACDAAGAPTYCVLTVLAGDRTRTIYLAEEQGPTPRLVTLEVVRSARDSCVTPGTAEARRDDTAPGTRASAGAVIDTRLTAAGDWCVIAEYSSDHVLRPSTLRPTAVARPSAP